MYDATSTYLDLERSDVDTAVFPVGDIEQHGSHLPLSVDWFQAEIVARLVAKRLDAFLLPAMPFGCSQAHAGFRFGYAEKGRQAIEAMVSHMVDYLQETFAGLGVPARNTS